MKRWFKMPCLMHQRGYITLPASARGVLVTIKELLSSEPVLSGNMNAYFRWTGVDRHTLKKSFEALHDLGLLRVEHDEKGEITITDPAASSTKVEHELPQSSTKVATNLSQGSTKVTSNLAQGSTKVTPNLTTQESSIDAGLDPAKMPLEENRIEKNRKEEKRKEEKKAPAGAASAEPPRASSPTVKRPDDIDEAIWRDWLRVRGRAPLTATAWEAMCREAAKAGISPGEAVKVCAERGWRGFRADWMERDKVVSMRGGRKEYDLNAMKFEPVYTADGEVSTNPADYW